MRLLFTSLVMLALLPGVHAAEQDIGGVWVASLCPPDVQRDSGKCASFVLELHQQDGKLCGTHLFSTAGAERIDEGAAPSLVGDISDAAARVTVVSGRSPVRVPAELKRAGNTLQWARLESPKGDYLLPPSARLAKSKKKTMFAPMFEQELKAACSSVFAMAAEAQRKQNEAAAPPGGTPLGGTPPNEAPRSDGSPSGGAPGR